MKRITELVSEVRCVFAGRATLDLIYVVDEYGQEDSKVGACQLLAQAGGPALNAAITFRHLGGDGLLVSAIGNSIFGNAIKAELENFRVPVCDCLTPSASSQSMPPISSVIVNRARATRTIFNSPNCLSTNLSAPGPVEGDMLLLDGFYVNEVREIVRQFSSRRSIICLDGGSWKDTTMDLIPYLTMAICSERFRPPGTASDDEVISFFISKGIKQVAITRGPLDVIGIDHDRAFTIAIEPVRAIDTLGAGDILHGAFCWHYLQTRDFENALRRAAVIASRSCTFIGARKWMEL